MVGGVPRRIQRFQTHTTDNRLLIINQGVQALFSNRKHFPPQAVHLVPIDPAGA